jgi:hypothetical protein
VVGLLCGPSSPAAWRRPVPALAKLALITRSATICSEVQRDRSDVVVWLFETPGRAILVRSMRPRRVCDMTSWREREARNETDARTRNEWIASTSVNFGARAATQAFVCECGDAFCTSMIELSHAEYEAVRSVGNRFAVALDHENPETEVVITEGPRFAVIDKIEGWGLRLARATDPRTGGRPQESH